MGASRTSPCILNQSTRCMRVVSLKLRSLQPKKRAIGTHYTRGQTGHTAGQGVFGEQEISWELGSLRKIHNERSTNLQSHSTMFLGLLLFTFGSGCAFLAARKLNWFWFIQPFVYHALKFGVDFNTVGCFLPRLSQSTHHSSFWRHLTNAVMQFTKHHLIY